MNLTSVHEDWTSLSGPGDALIERRRSLFYGHARPIHSEAEALDFLAELRAARPDCNHHVYAWRVGRATPPFLQRFSDDGEPSGTGGQPVLQRLDAAGLEDCLVVVSRVFGGVLLGTGGLIRAYGDAAAEAIAAATVVTMVWTQQLELTIDYALYGALERYCQEEGIVILERDFGAAVRLTLALPARELEACRTRLMDLTAGQAAITEGERSWRARVE